MNAVKQRKGELTLMNVALCLCVVFVHCAAEPIDTLSPVSWQYIVMFALWRMTKIGTVGFLFLSGLKLFLGKRDAFSYGRFWKLRLFRIIVPYLIWVTLYYLWFVREGYYSFDWGQLFRGFWLGDMAAQFYFIPILIQFCILVPLWRLWTPRANPALAMTVCALLTVIFGVYLPEMTDMLGAKEYFIYNDRVFSSYLMYWMGGCLAGYYYEAFTRMLRECFGRIAVGFALAAVFDCAMQYLQYAGFRAVYWSVFTCMLYRVLALLFIFACCLRRSERRELKSALIMKMDGAGYLVYLVHVLIIYIINKYLNLLSITDISARFFLRLGLTLAISYGLCILWKQLLARLRKKRKTAA